MSREKLNNVSDIIERLKMFTQSSNDATLSRFLGVGTSRIPMWKKRGVIDLLLITQKCEGINTDWLLTGEGEMFEGKTDEKQGEKQCSEAVQQEKQVQEIWTKEKDRLSMYAWGSRMTPDSIEEDDFLIVDTTIEPKKGDYVYRKGEDGPEIVRYQEGDAVPIGVLIGLKREYR